MTDNRDLVRPCPCGCRHSQRQADALGAAEAENERHRKANLVRAVTSGLEPEWLLELVNSKGFDAVPWKITERFKARADAAEADAAHYRTAVEYHAQDCSHCSRLPRPLHPTFGDDTVTDNSDLIRHIAKVGLVQTARTQALCMTQNYSADLIRVLADALEAAEARADAATNLIIAAGQALANGPIHAGDDIDERFVAFLYPPTETP